MCRWAAARPRAVRAASFARRVVSKPGQAPPPPTGTAAGPSGALDTGGACGSGVPGQAPPPPTSTAARPTGPLRRPPHRRRCVAGVWLGACCYKRRQSEGIFAENAGFLAWIDDVCNVGRPLVARPGPIATAQVSRPDLTCRIAETAPNFARNSPVTLSYIEFRSLELQRFLTMLKLCSIELRATFLGIWPCLHPRVPQQASAPASQFRMQFLCGCFMR